MARAIRCPERPSATGAESGVRSRTLVGVRLLGISVRGRRSARSLRPRWPREGCQPSADAQGRDGTDVNCRAQAFTVVAQFAARSARPMSARSASGVSSPVRMSMRAKAPGSETSWPVHSWPSPRDRTRRPSPSRMTLRPVWVLSSGSTTIPRLGARAACSINSVDTAPPRTCARSGETPTRLRMAAVTG